MSNFKNALNITINEITENAKYCCKEDTIHMYHSWVQSDRTGYSDELVSIFKGAEAYADMCGYEIEELFDKINWNKGLQTQLIDLFSKAYWDTQM